MCFFHGIGPPIYQWHKRGERGKEGEREIEKDREGVREGDHNGRGKEK